MAKGPYSPSLCHWTAYRKVGCCKSDPLAVPIMEKRSGSMSRHTAASSSVLLSFYIGHLVCACGEFRLQYLVDVKYNQEINNKKITGPKRSIDKRIAERKSSFAFLCQQKTRFEIARGTKKHLWLLVLFFSFFISQ